MCDCQPWGRHVAHTHTSDTHTDTHRSFFHDDPGNNESGWHPDDTRGPGSQNTVVYGAHKHNTYQTHTCTHTQSPHLTAPFLPVCQQQQRAQCTERRSPRSPSKVPALRTASPVVLPVVLQVLCDGTKTTVTPTSVEGTREQRERERERRAPASDLFNVCVCVCVCVCDTQTHALTHSRTSPSISRTLRGSASRCVFSP